MAYSLAFVDSITTSPTTRLDLMSGSWLAQAEGTEFPPPPLRRAVVSTLLADGERVPAAAYANRVIRVRLQCTATTEDGAATALQALARELDRPQNVLRYQVGTTNPVYFRTLRAEFDAIQWDPMTRFASVSIPAEPFAYGPVESLGSVTVYNDPAYRPALNANPDFETDVSNWGPSGGATIARSTAQAHLGSASMLLTPDGVTVGPQARSERVTVTAGKSYVARGWLYGSARTRLVRINWYDGSDTLLSSSDISVAMAASTWTQFGPTAFTAPTNATGARIVTRDDGTPAASDFWYADQLQISDASADPVGCVLDISNVKGDVETPLIVSMASTDSSTLRPTSLFAVRRRGTPSNAPFLQQAESLSLTTDTSTPGNDPAMSGTGFNYARCSFATTSGLTSRVVTAGNLSLPTDARGIYRIFARLRTTVGTDTIQVQWGWGNTSNSGVILNDAVTINSTSSSAYGPFYYELGLMQFPAGPDPVHDGYSGVELAVDQPFFGLYARRVSGTGSLDIDHFLFVPADDRLLLVKWPTTGTGYTWVLDGTHEMAIAKDNTGAIFSGNPAQLSGGVPMISPNVANRVVFVRTVGIPGAFGAPSPDAITNTVTLTPSYYPRYLYVRPATT